MTIPVEELSFIPSGTSTKRSLADWSSDMFLNVKNFGAQGDNATNDTTAIQACFDAAYGSSSSPHAHANRFLNRPVYFPPGIYITSSPLTLTSVEGAHIFGSATGDTTILGSISINGMVSSRIENLQLFGPGSGAAGSVGLNIDWNGSGTVALNNNKFCAITLGNFENGFKIGASGNDGAANLFLHCQAAGCVNGYNCISSEAIANSIIGGGLSSNTVGVWQQAGSFSNMQNSAGGTNTTDFKLDGGHAVSISGGRSEHCTTVIDLISGVCSVSGVQAAEECINFANVHTGAILVVDACQANGTSSTGAVFLGGGKLYIRGNNPVASHPAFPNNSYLTGFTGTVVQNI